MARRRRAATPRSDRKAWHAALRPAYLLACLLVDEGRVGRQGGPAGRRPRQCGPCCRLPGRLPGAAKGAVAGWWGDPRGGGRSCRCTLPARATSAASTPGTSPTPCLPGPLPAKKGHLFSASLCPCPAAEKSHFAELAVDAVLRLKGSTNLDAIQIIKKAGGTIKVRLHGSSCHVLRFNNSLAALCLLRTPGVASPERGARRPAPPKQLAACVASGLRPPASLPHVGTAVWQALATAGKVQCRAVRQQGFRDDSAMPRL